MDGYGVSELTWIAVALLLYGMGKGGLPVHVVALPMLILVWPTQGEAARAAVAFLLPVLCAMDVVAMLFYRRRIQWRRLLPLFPGMLVGVVLASVLFVSKNSALLSMSDHALKLCIGFIGLLFVLYRAISKWLLKRLSKSVRPGFWQSTVFGFAAGLSSTIAHQGGPPIQMYLLPQKLPKLEFAGTTVAFFFVLNLVKMVPFSMLGRIEAPNLLLAAKMLPIMPVGVVLGYLGVRVMKPKHYVGFIYVALFLTSALLVVRTLTTGG